MTMQQTTGSVMTPRRWEWQQIQAEDLVAVLFIEDEDRRELWVNCGQLIYDQRIPSIRSRSCPPLIGR